MKVLITLVLVSFVADGSNADEPLVWPRFRGPNGSGVAKGQKPPQEFGPDKNVKWKASVPSGISSPIVAGDNLVLTAFDNGKLWTIAYRRTDGQEAWRAQAPAKSIELFHKTEGSPAASTPATDGQRIVSYFGSCGLFCYDLAGNEQWRFEMPTAVIGGGFGSGVSPIIVDGLAILVRDELKGSKIVAVELSTGALRWEQKRSSAVSWCSPVVWDTGAVPQVVAAGHMRMTGYELASGAEQWSVFGMPAGCCPSPVVADGTLFFAGSSSDAEDARPMPPFDSVLKFLDKDKDGAISKAEGEQAFRGAFDNQDANRDGRIVRDEYEWLAKLFSEGKNIAFALKSGGSGDITESNTLWKRTKGLPYVASAIVYRGQMVVVKDGGIVVACDAKTGDQAYQQRLAATGRYYASPVAADGRIYFTSMDSGAVTVVAAGSKKPVVISRNRALGERCSATPAIADDTLYVRTATQLYAFAEKP